MRTLAISIGFFALGCGLFAQTYRCDWWVVAAGGGELSGNYRCGVTVAQSATGVMSGANLMAFIGFWQSDRGVGVTEQGGQPGLPVTVTRLERVFPNPSHSLVHLSYSLARKTDIRLDVLDISGRLVKRLMDTKQGPGRYHLTWNCGDNAGRPVPSGLYFLRFNADNHQEVKKLVLEH